MPRTKGTKNKQSSSSKTDMIARGAAGVAVAAGVVAAGAALANKDTRKKLGHTAKVGMENLQSMASNVGDEAQSSYQTTAHQVSSKVGGKSSRGRKKSQKKS